MDGFEPEGLLDASEFFDALRLVARAQGREYTRVEFDVDWAEFQRQKEIHERNRSLQ